MLPVSIQVRQALGKLVLPVLLLLSVGVMIAGQVEKRATEKARMAVAGTLAPLWNMVSHARAGVADVSNGIRQACNGFVKAVRPFRHKITDDHSEVIRRRCH